MTEAIDWTSSLLESGFLLVLEPTLKGALLLTVALATAGLLRRVPASLRHSFWAVTFVGLLLLPALTLALPSWRVPLLRTAGPDDPAAVTAGLETSSQPDPERYGGRGSPVSDPGIEGGELANGSHADGQATAARRNAATDSAGFLSPGSVLLAVWVAGFGLLLGRTLLQHLRAFRLRSRSAPLDDPKWVAEARSAASTLGMTDPAPVHRSSEVRVPLVSGILDPVILVPDGARSWESGRRRSVLLHELAHVQRKDCLVQVAAEVARALHWLNPLSSIAVRKLLVERERACDDVVLETGTARTSYADLLLSLARRAGPTTTSVGAGVAMARRGELEGRLLAILDRSRPRTEHGPVLRAALFGLVLALTPVLAAFQPVSAESESAPEERTASQPGTAERTTAAFAVDPSAENAPVPAVLPESGLTPADTTAAAKRATAATVDEVVASADTIMLDRVLGAFVEALESEDPDVRRQAARGLGSAEAAAAVDPLIPLFRSDPDPDVREAAAWALGMIEDSAAVEPLLLALDSGSDALREQVVWALGMIEDGRATADLIRMLDDANDGVREQAAWALGKIEDRAATSALVRTLGEDPVATVRRQAAWALGTIEDPDAAQMLLRAWENDQDEDVRADALEALRKVVGELPES